MAIVDSPIPGENYTADTRNYPWHRPADIDNYNDVVDHLISNLEKPTGISLVYSLLDLEVSISGIVTALLLQEISKGRIHIDMAIIAAGPLARHIEIFARKNKIKYEMGDKPSDEIVYTPTELKLAMGIIDPSEDTEKDAVAVEPIQATGGGFMAQPSLEETTEAPEDEQLRMLGMIDETEDELETEDGMA
jgi:hypothetical protein